MKICFLFPRLDISFKNFGGAVPEQIGEPNHPIRMFWNDFRTRIIPVLEHAGHDVHVMIKPMWEITPEFVQGLNDDRDEEDRFDLFLVPHKERQNFNVWPTPVLYYMQMVYPWTFSIDPAGWLSSAFHWPIKPKDHDEHPRYDELLTLAGRNISKFEQPTLGNESALPDKYLFLPLQLPHDENIILHSSVSMAQAIHATLGFGTTLNIPVVVKPHPINPAAMQDMRKVFDFFANPEYHYWIDNVSVHDCIENSEAVFTVNSGVGMETIMHNKPLFSFGESEYDEVSHELRHYDSIVIEDLYGEKDKYLPKYKDFIETWCETHYSTKHPDTFDKLNALVSATRLLYKAVNH